MFFTSCPLLPAIKKYVLPASLLNNVVYNFSCHCNSRYVGRTSQRLQEQIRQHVPKFIRIGQIPNSRNISTRSGKSSTPVKFSKSTIGQQLVLDSHMCAMNYSDEKFSILYFGRSSFHLCVLEAVYIKSCMCTTTARGTRREFFKTGMASVVGDQNALSTTNRKPPKIYSRNFPIRQRTKITL